MIYSIPGQPIETFGGCVYICSVPSGSHKVGVAHDPVGRIKGFQTGNHEDITFEGASVPFETGIGPIGLNAYDLERETHYNLSLTQERRGEWFQAPLEVVINAYHLAKFRLTDRAASCFYGDKEWWPRNLKICPTQPHRTYIRDELARERGLLLSLEIDYASSPICEHLLRRPKENNQT